MLPRKLYCTCFADPLRGSYCYLNLRGAASPTLICITALRLKASEECTYPPCNPTPIRRKGNSQMRRPSGCAGPPAGSNAKPSANAPNINAQKYLLFSGSAEHLLGQTRIQPVPVRRKVQEVYFFSAHCLKVLSQAFFRSDYPAPTGAYENEPVTSGFATR